MKLSPSFQRKARIEIIPLIDIVFFLLATFVMLSLSMVKNQGINVNLPAAGTGVSQERKISLTLTATEKGDVYFNQEKISFDSLPARLQQLKSVNPDVKVFINADKKTYFENAVKLLDAVRVVGITKVAIQTKGADASGK